MVAGSKAAKDGDRQAPQSVGTEAESQHSEEHKSLTLTSDLLQGALAA